MNTAPSTPWTPPPLNELQLAALQNGDYDFLIPLRKAIMRIDEAASMIHRSTDFVLHLVEQGRLEVHCDGPQADAPPSNVVTRITRRSVLLYLASTAAYDQALILTLIQSAMKTLKAPTLDLLIEFATREKNAIS